MSALAFQKAMAQLIRFPKEPLEKVEAGLGPNALTELERGRLLKMAGDPLVSKFGFKMRFLRQRDATAIMRVSKDFLDPKALEIMYVEYFEPTRTSSDLTMLGVQFLEFCLGDSRCLSILAEGEPFLKDLILYDYTRAAVEREVIRLEDPLLPPGSLLAHRAFRIIDLGYDVPAIDRLKVKSPDSKTAPVPKAIKLIIMRSPRVPYYRMFEIDQNIANFLLAQREAPGSYTDELPKAYSGMVGVGLCRQLTS